MYNLPNNTQIKANIYGKTIIGTITDMHNGYYIIKDNTGIELFVHPEQVNSAVENEIIDFDYLIPVGDE